MTGLYFSPENRRSLVLRTMERMNLLVITSSATCRRNDSTYNSVRVLLVTCKIDTIFIVTRPEERKKTQ